jgi:hypothetical protein
MKHDTVILTLTIIGTTASVLSMLFTASIALKCNGKVVKSIERRLGIKIAEP